MKRIMILILCLLWSSNLWATNIRPTDEVTIATRTIYNDGNLAIPDSVRIQVIRNGTELSDAWYNAGDAQGESTGTGGWLNFHDQLQDIDGAGGDGHYIILGRAYDDDSTLYTPWVYNFDVGIWGEVDGIGGWSPITDNDSLIIDHTTLNAAVVDVNTASMTGGAIGVGDFATGAITGDAWAASATDEIWEADTSTISAAQGIGTVLKDGTDLITTNLIYVGPRGLGIYLDSAAGNTNTVLGTDGTAKNPVSTIAAAKTLATALGYNRYYFLNASTFNDAANDLPSSHQNWEFIGIANSNALAFGTQRVDESRFENMNLSGTMHASGGNVLYTNCTLGYITANFNGHAFNCLLADTIVVKADVDIEFVRCQSDVGGNRTPTIDLSGGSSVVQVRAYSGGIRIMNGASNDTISIETDGQVIIASNNTSLNITVRGMATLTDNGTTTNLTKDAVFSRQEADLWVWANVDTANTVDTSLIGEWLASGVGGGSSNWTDAQRDSVLANMEDGAITSTKLAANAIGSSQIATAAIGNLEIATNAIASAELATSAITEIAQGTWDEDTTGRNAANSFGLMLKDTLAYQGAASGLTVAAIWQHPIRDDTTDGAVDDTSAADHLYSASVGGGASNWSDAQRDSVLRNMEDRAISLVKLDSAFLAVITEGIWLDDGASNTNTTVGIDGTITNPVSTLAAARILADSQSLQKYYLINNSSFTLAATYEDWDFIGLGESNEINFGGQDIDNSHFEHLMVAGVQGGTGLIWLNECYMDAADSLECVARNSWFSDTVSVRVASNIIFDNCFSAIPGNNTPAIDFNSAAGVVSVNIRHYSGGIAFINGGSTVTVSVETDGQIVIDASCTSINVTARGNMTITDNGTTTNLTDMAVFNVNAVAEYPEYNVKGVIEDSSGNTAAIFQTDLAASTNDLYNRQQIRFISGNNAGAVTQIIDYVGATGVIRVSPGLVGGGANAGDSIEITGSLIGLLANTDSVLVNVSGNAAVYADTVLRPPDSTEIFDASLERVWYDRDTTNVDSSDIGDWMTNNLAGGAASLPDSVVARIDSIFASVGDSLETHVGRDGLSTTTVGLHMKVGGYVGGAGSNIEDDFDTVLVKIAAIAIGSGSGANACTIYVKAGSDYIQGVNVRLQSSGGTDYYDDTDSDGKSVFALDDGTYYGYATITGHTQDVIPDTFTFTADYNDTLLMTPFAPTAPSGDLTTLYNWVVDGNDQGVNNVVVEAYIPNKFWPVKNANKAIRARHSTKTDSVGYWELQIFGNDIVLTNQGDSSSYWMVASDEGTFKHKVTVSSDSSTQLMIKDSD